MEGLASDLKYGTGGKAADFNRHVNHYNHKTLARIGLSSRGHKGVRR
jgi:hypothetical protein